MAGTPQFKVYSPTNEYVAACKRAVDAAHLAFFHGAGATVRHGHSQIVWREGSEAITGYDSYKAGQIITNRVASIWSRAAERINRQRNADHVDGYDRDDLGESPDY